MKNRFLFLPTAIPFFLLLIFLPFFLLAMVALFNISAEAVVRRSMGLSVLELFLAYFTILFGSVINIPVYEFKSKANTEPRSVSYMGMKYQLPVWHGYNSIIAINLGGSIFSLLAAIYLMISLPHIPLILTTLIVALGVFGTSHPAKSMGIIVPMLIPAVIAISASFIAIYIYMGGDAGLYLGRLAFSSGAFGTLIGAYIFHMNSIRKTGANMVSIGGIGSFDAILLTGIFATVLTVILSLL